MSDYSENELLTVDQVAQITKLHPKTIREFVRKGEIAIVKVGVRGYRIRLKELTRFINEREGKWDKGDHE
jgi:excisionase family DNA binding protein